MRRHGREVFLNSAECKKNLNNIDLLLKLDYPFLNAVALLERLLKEYQGKNPPTEPTPKEQPLP